MQHNSSPTNTSEQTFLDFISSTRLGFVLTVCFVISVVWFTSLGIRVREEGGALIAFNVSFGVPLLAFALWKRPQFTRMFYGESDMRKVLLMGLIPALGLSLFWGILAVSLSHTFHAPLADYVPDYFVYGPAFPVLLLLQPFINTMIYHLWLQTRLQQLLRGFSGALLTAILLCALMFLQKQNHVGAHPSFIFFIYASGIALYTWLRWRYKSLGMVLISQYAFSWLLSFFALVFIPHAG